MRDAYDDLGLWGLNSSPQRMIANILPHFTIKICLERPRFYSVVARDPFHYLSCALALEVRESDDESEFGDLVCRFPMIEDGYLEAFVWEDVALIDPIMALFRIKILEQLLLFCANCNAIKLTIYADVLEANQLKDFNDFIVQKDQVTTYRGESTAFMIPTDRATYDKVIERMKQMSTDFQDFLYKNQHKDHVIQQYIKLNAFC